MSDPVALHTSASGGAAIASSVSATGVAAGTDVRYFAFVSMRALRTITSVTGGGLTWSLVGTVCHGRAQVSSELWTAFGSPGSSFTVEANLNTASNGIGMVVVGYVNTDGAVSDFVRSNTQGTTGACSGGTDSNSASITISVTEDAGAHAVLFTGPRTRNVSSSDPNYGFITSGGGGDAGDLTNAAVHDRAAPPSGNHSATHGLSGVADWAMAAVVVHGAAPSVALIQVATDDNGGVDATSVTATFGSTPTEGNLLIALTGSTPRNYDIVPSGWQLATNGEGGEGRTNIFYKIAGASEPTAYTFGFSDGTETRINLHLHEWSGMHSVLGEVLDKTASWHEADATTVETGTTPTTAYADELAIGILRAQNGRTFSDITNDFIVRSTLSRTVTTSRLLTETGAYGHAGTIDPANTASGAIATFRIASDYDPPNLQHTVDAGTVTLTWDPSPMVPE